MTDEDRELLALAARAHGNIRQPEGCDALMNDDTGQWWNPRDDDGDALRLAAKLELSIHVLGLTMSVSQRGGSGPLGGYLGGWLHRSLDDAADYRLAITRGAAAIGKTMQPAGVLPPLFDKDPTNIQY